MKDQNNSLPLLPSIMLPKPVKCNMFNRTFVSKAVPVFQKNQSNWKKEVVYGSRSRSTSSSWVLLCFILEQSQVSLCNCILVFSVFLSPSLRLSCIDWCSSPSFALKHNLAPLKSILHASIQNIFLVKTTYSFTTPPLPLASFPEIKHKCLCFFAHFSEFNSLGLSLSMPHGHRNSSGDGEEWKQQRKKSPSKGTIQLLRLTTKYDVLKMLLVRLGTKVLQP